MTTLRQEMIELRAELAEFKELAKALTTEVENARLVAPGCPTIVVGDYCEFCGGLRTYDEERKCSETTNESEYLRGVRDGSQRG